MSLSRFLRSLQQATPPHTFNPWTDLDPSTDISRTAPRDRLDRLTAHLSINAKYLLIGEAPGYQGCKVTGIPFTSERLILEGLIPRVSTTAARLTLRHRPWSEPSATIVWRTLHALGLAEETILWNAFPWHPHKPGIAPTPITMRATGGRAPQARQPFRHSNRTPTTAERPTGLPILNHLLKLYPKVQSFAVGRNAEWSLQQIGCQAMPVRHPSMGGAIMFAQQLANAIR